MARYTAEAVYIASIYPGKLTSIQKYHGDTTNPREGRAKRYYLPPVYRGIKPVIPEGCKNVKAFRTPHDVWVAVLEVTDAFELVPNPLKADGGRMAWDMSPVDCHQIATNLHAEWAGNFVAVPAGASPGIKIIINTVPTPDELDEMLNMQKSFYDFLLSEGDRHSRQNEWREITQYMRDAANYLRQERAWSGSGITTVDCPHCLQPIQKTATVCYHCSRDVKPALVEAEPETVAVGPASK